MTKLIGEQTHREIDPKFGDTPVGVREFQTLEPVPQINSDPHPDGGPTYADVEVTHTVYSFEQGGMIVRRATVKGNPRIIDVKVQISDAYGYQREFSVENRRIAGTSTFRWEANTYLHPYHTVDQVQVISEGVAKRFMERLIELVENYPSLVFNNSAFTSHTPPRYRPRHEGFIRWHTALLNGANLSVKLLD
jgi:hypothetical protein